MATAISGVFCTLLRFSISLLAGLMVLAQLVSSAVGIYDFPHEVLTNKANTIITRNDLATLQRAITEADQLAHRYHANHIYIIFNGITISRSPIRQFAFLSEQIRTATTIINGPCAIVPDVAAGPAVVLMGPYAPVPSALLTHLAKATPLGQLKRPEGAPFRFYLVQPVKLQADAAAGSRLGPDLRLDTPPQSFSAQGAAWLATRWSLLRSAPSGFMRMYSYTITIQPAAAPSTTGQCMSTALRAGDHLLMAFPNRAAGSTMKGSNLILKGQFQETDPVLLHSGPLTFLTYSMHTTTRKLSGENIVIKGEKNDNIQSFTP